MVRIEIAAIASILLTLVSCSLKEQPQAPQKDGSFEYSVSTDVSGTKTTMSNDGKASSFRFITGDKIGLFIGDLHTNSKFTCSDGLSGTFSGKLKGLGITESGVQYCSYYPYSSTSGTSATAVEGILSSVQCAPFDSTMDYMVANPVTAKYDEEDMPSLSFTFANHLFGIVKLSVKDLSGTYSSEKILSTGLKSNNKPLTGSFTFDVTDPSESAVFTSALTSKKVVVEYDEDDRPVLGTDETHSVYAIVNAAIYSTGELTLEVSTTNYVFSIPTTKALDVQRNILSVFPVVDLSFPSVSRRNRVQTIVLWGDSITGDSLLKAVQKELGSSWNVIRGGVAADAAYQVAARQGGLPMVTGKEFTIPASSSEYVYIDGIYAREGEPGSYTYKQATHEWTYKSGYCPLLNPLIIQGVECEISYDTETKPYYRIRRMSDGSELTVPEHSDVSTFGAREYAGVDAIVVYIGTNGRPSDASNDSYLISVHNAMKAHLTNPDARMLVYGFHQSTTDMPKYWTSAYVAAFTSAYGSYFIDMRTLGGGENAKHLMKEMGQITDESQISSDDLVYINRGDWPISWFRDVGDVHPNDQYGASVMAILLRRRMEELGML